jgi:hypothetical protein
VMIIKSELDKSNSPNKKAKSQGFAQNANIGAK